MKREIKFRAWDKENKRMIYSGMDYELQMLQIPDNCFIEEKNSQIGFGINDWNYFNIMQFTGLKDKNSKEIYEGDIVKVILNDILCTIVFVDGCFSTQTLYSFKKGTPEYSFIINDSIEVIGNIYENSELLNK